MCCHYLSGMTCSEAIGSREECSSPFGIYDLSMPIDSTIPCQTTTNPIITHENCQNFNVSLDIRPSISQRSYTWFNIQTYSLSNCDIWKISIRLSICCDPVYHHHHHHQHHCYSLLKKTQGSIDFFFNLIKSRKKTIAQVKFSLKK